ncbi:hypothetical protein [Algibacillus agarilyticus]|uniref:hypothetical protein n=1 Tax=Algibacillus agarilyticus TaxID=2234133 RepID=UPI0013009EBF|nr:hypothetical protein [Algibacillus agarilyticus]
MSANKEALGFAKTLATQICDETPTKDNPFLAEERHISGYNIFDISQKLDYIETIFLLFKLELPSSQQKVLLNTLFNFLSNLGPRHPAIRAAMTAGVSKANVEHLLPIGLMTLGGENGGANEVERAYRFIEKINQTSLSELDDLSSRSALNNKTPGFGTRFAQVDPIAQRFAEQLLSLTPDTECLKKCQVWLEQINSSNNQPKIGWLESGIAAAVFYELRVGAREAAGLFQLACAPGILAHGVEQTHKPITAMPLLEDNQYELRK